MSFFKRFPKLWITLWAIFGFGGFLMILRSVGGDPVEWGLVARGIIGLTLAVMMISYLLPELRTNNAQD